MIYVMELKRAEIRACCTGKGQGTNFHSCPNADMGARNGAASWPQPGHARGWGVLMPVR